MVISRRFLAIVTCPVPRGSRTTIPVPGHPPIHSITGLHSQASGDWKLDESSTTVQINDKDDGKQLICDEEPHMLTPEQTYVFYPITFKVLLLHDVKLEIVRKLGPAGYSSVWLARSDYAYHARRWFDPLLRMGMFWRFLRKSPIDNLPGPPPRSWLFGNIPDFFNPNGWDFHRQILKCYGGIFRIRGFLGERLLVVYDADALYHILIKHQALYELATPNVLRQQLVFGPGLLGTLGDQHRKQRKILNPVFSAKYMRNMFPLFYEVTERLRAVLKKKLEKGPQEVDVLFWIGRSALEIIGQSGMDYSFDLLIDDNDYHPYSKAVKRLAALINGPVGFLGPRLVLPYAAKINLPRFKRFIAKQLPFQRVQELIRAVDVMHRTSIEIIEAKKKAIQSTHPEVVAEMANKKDIINLLMKANAKASQEDRLSDAEVVGQISTFVFAAMDTTTSAVSRILHLVATHQDVQDRLREEIQDAQKIGQVDYDKLVSLPYLDAVCRETLRLFPPVPFMPARTARRDMVLPLSKPITDSSGQQVTEIVIKNGTNVVISILAANRNPAIWGDDAHEWKPERWLSPPPKTVTEARIPGVYSHLMTFGAGSRACIGFKFSQLEMMLYVTWGLFWRFLRKSPVDDLPGPPVHSWLFGNILEFFNPNGWDFHRGLLERYGNIVKIRGLLGERLLVTHDADAIYHVLVKDQDFFELAAPTLLRQQLIFGPGLLGSLGDQHKKQRKILNPVFSAKYMRDMVPLFYEVTERLRVVLKKKLEKGPQEVDMLFWVSRTALEIIGQSGMDYSFDSLIDENDYHPYSKAVRRLPALATGAIGFLGARLILPYAAKIKLPRLKRFIAEQLPFQRVQELIRASDVMYRTSIDIVEAKKKVMESTHPEVVAEMASKKDLISLLMRANAKASEEDRLSDAEVIGQISTFVFAAMDTTTSAVCRTLQLIATHQDVQAKLREEIQEAQSFGQVEYDKLITLPYLDAVCRETLRLFPPIPFLPPRTARRDMVLPLSKPLVDSKGKQVTEIVVEKGTNIVISNLAANRDPQLWGDDAYEWKPERWLSPPPKSIVEAHMPGLYSHLMTFGAGGRGCIGFKFSQLEMKALLSVLLTSFRFSLSDKPIGWRMNGITGPVVEAGDHRKPQLPLQMSLI
ncbi:hypothetical protein D9756_002095 [Leucocoprinus leucothites]|uniref:Cytochrome P450 n=1 Tax=Leucocoprinus leucothites TaxID=201217 RepID=A0A8H5GBU6_9AGAR|nr:hypothetical protein D9756_002095 [Leucoagaricus leucothites]